MSPGIYPYGLQPKLGRNIMTRTELWGQKWCKGFERKWKGHTEMMEVRNGVMVWKVSKKDMVFKMK